MTSDPNREGTGTGPTHFTLRSPEAQKCYEDGHDWMPWLKLPNGSDWTMCGRCGRQEQYDHEGRR
jgi:hypothetical protein